MKRDYIGYALAIVSIVIAIIVSWYFYEKSVQRREPFFAADYVPSTVFDVNREIPIPLRVLREDGDALTDSVHVATHRFANLGNAPISRDDLLTPLVIKLSAEGSELLGVSITRQSRDVVSCAVRQDSSISFTLSFRILEQDDGCEIRTFYAGRRSPKYVIDGEIVGVKKIGMRSENVYDIIEKEPDWIGRVIQWSNAAAGIVPFLAFSAMMLSYMARPETSGKKSLTALAGTIAVGGVIIWSIYAPSLLRSYDESKSVNAEAWVQVGK